MKSSNRWISLFLALVLLLSALSVAAGAAEQEPAQQESTFTAVFAQPYAKPGEPLTVVCSELQDISYEWYADGVRLNCTADSYVPSEKDLEKLLEVRLYSAGTLQKTLTMLCSRLPVIYLDTQDGAAVTSKDEYIDAQLTIQGNDLYNEETTTLYTGKTEVKGHGNSTWKWFPKKPYKLKLDKKTSLFGMGKNKHWLLIANYIDESCVRNAFSGAVADVYGVEKMDFVFVDVVLNGKKQGIYQLSEQVRISSDRVDIFDWEDAADALATAVTEKESLSKDESKALGTYLEENYGWVTDGVFSFGGKDYTVSEYYELPAERNGGYLLELDNNYDEISKFTTLSGAPVMFKSPEFICSAPAWMGEVQSHIQQFESAAYAADHCLTVDGKKLSYLDFCDEESLFAYYLTSELLVNEAGGRSTYLYKDLDGKLVFGPVWDFDWSADTVSSFGFTDPEHWVVQPRYWFSAMSKDPYFAVKVRELYLKNADAIDALYADDGKIDQWDDYIREAAVANSEMWHYSRGFEQDTHAMKTWLDRRIAWINKQFATDASALLSFGGCVDNDITMAVNNAQKTNEGYIIRSTGEEDAVVTVHTLPALTFADYYVNGRYAGTAQLLDGVAEITVPSALLKEKNGSKNVISVIAHNDAGETLRSFVTVKYVAADTKTVTVTFQNRDTLTDIDIIAGTDIYITAPACPEAEYFTAWTDGQTEFPAGVICTVYDNCTLSADYIDCISQPAHTFVKVDDGYRCTVCEAQKKDASVNTSLYCCVVSISSRYGTRYTGAPTGPAITLSYNGQPLTEGVDYIMTCKNNVLPGFATFTMTGIKSAGYCDSVSQTFRILPRKISAAGGKFSFKSVKYTGKEQRPLPTVTYNGMILTEGKDYTLTYSDNIYPGKATVLLTGMGNYTETKKLTFTISHYAPDVTGVGAAKASHSSIRISWAKCKSAKGYSIYCATKKNGTYKKVATVYGAKKTEYIHTGVATGTKYYYKVLAIETVNGKDYESNITAATIKSATATLAKPSVSSVKSTAYNTLKVTWSKVTGATGYQVYRATAKNGTYKKAATVKSATSYTDKSCKTGTKYYYKVRAYCKVDGKTVYGAFSAVKSGAAALGKPVLKTAKAAKSAVTLKWSKTAGASGYIVYRATAKNGKYTAVKTLTKGSAVSAKDTSVKSGKTYYYKLKAYRTVDKKKVYSAVGNIIKAK